MTSADASRLTSPWDARYKWGSTPGPISPITWTRSPPTTLTASATMPVVATAVIAAAPTPSVAPLQATERSEMIRKTDQTLAGKNLADDEIRTLLERLPEDMRNGHSFNADATRKLY